MSATKGWQLNGAAFERLLGVLDDDRDRAGLEYERLHDRISRLLAWWGAGRASELADQTLDRVARRLEEGADIRKGSFGAYVRGVARMIYYESRRQEPDPLAEDFDLAAPVSDPDRQITLSCLDGCLQTLSPDDRRCLLRYYDDEGERTIDRRRRLAEELGATMTVLRVRTHRLRRRVEDCIRNCRARAMERPVSTYPAED